MRRTWASGIRIDWRETKLNTQYDVKLYRIGTTMYCDYYQSDILVWSDVLEDVEIPFNYFYPIIGRGSGNSQYFVTATFKNFVFSAI
jgi:hypothetical protein